MCVTAAALSDHSPTATDWPSDGPLMALDDLTHCMQVVGHKTVWLFGWDERHRLALRGTEREPGIDNWGAPLITSDCR